MSERMDVYVTSRGPNLTATNPDNNVIIAEWDGDKGYSQMPGTWGDIGYRAIRIAQQDSQLYALTQILHGMGIAPGT